MRHRDIAELWHGLRNASDITYLLREAIGELSTFLIHSEHVASEEHLRSTFLCKAIFDVQRIHLYTQNRDEKKSVELKTLVDAISCLVKIKNAIDQPSSHNANHESRRLLQQAFVSGLRVLTLRLRVSTQRGPILKCIAEWGRTWNTSSEVDEDIIRRLLEDACQFDDRDATGLELAEADARGPAMFFLHNWTLIKDQLNASLRNSNDILSSRRFWLFYDAKLALFNASYEFLWASGNNPSVGLQDNSATHTGFLEELKDCVQIFGSILSQSTSHHSRRFVTFLEELEPTPYCHDCKPSCSCFPPRDSHAVSSCSQLKIIKQLNNYLSRRGIAVFNGSSGLDNLLKLLEKRKDEWLVKQTTADSEQVYEMLGANSVNWSQSVLRASYVLNCPRMHCVSGETLLNWMRMTRLSLNSQELYQNAHSFEINISCVCCSTERNRPTPATFARRVAPLCQLSDDITALQAGWKDWRPLNDDSIGQDEIDLPPGPLTSPASPMQASSSGPHPERRPDVSTDTSPTHGGTTSSHGSFSRFSFSRSRRNSSDLATRKFQSVVTAEGSHVYVWYRSKLVVYSTMTKGWLEMPSIDGDIHMLCASSTILCVVIKAAGGFSLLVYRMPNCLQVGQAILIEDEVFCMGLSHNQQFLLIGTSKQIIRICILLRASGWELVEQRRGLSLLADSSQQTTVESQAVSFSPRSERAVLATRFGPNGNVMCSIYDMTRQDGFSSKAKIPLRKPLEMTATRDFGLTAVPCTYDPGTSTTTFLVCCSVDHAVQQLWCCIESETRARVKLADVMSSGSNGEPGPSVHKAISLPQTSAFLMVNELGHLWTLKKPLHSSTWNFKHHRLLGFPQSSENERPRFHLAAISLGRVHICCVKKGKLQLFVYNMESAGGTEMHEIELTPFLT